MKWLIGLIAAVSGLFAGAPKDNVLPLNMAVIAFNQTYYSPVITSPDVLPVNYSKIIKTKSSAETSLLASVNPKPPKPTPPPPPPLAPSAPPSPPAPAPTPAPPTPLVAAITAPAPAPAGDPYLANPEPILNWLKMNFSFMGDGFEGTREFSPITIDREYWKVDIWAYWISINPTVKTPVEPDYFKIEVYEEGNSTPVFSAASGKDESPHIYQSFKKPGKYYFKTYTKPVSKYEINLYVSPTLAK